MKKHPAEKRSKPYLKALFWGTISVCAYAYVFMNQDSITYYFTLGGKYAALPIITAFLFSFVHGSFANYILSVFGIEARKRK